MQSGFLFCLKKNWFSSILFLVKTVRPKSYLSRIFYNFTQQLPKFSSADPSIFFHISSELLSQNQANNNPTISCLFFFVLDFYPSSSSDPIPNQRSIPLFCSAPNSFFSQFFLLPSILLLFCAQFFLLPIFSFFHPSFLVTHSHKRCVAGDSSKNHHHCNLRCNHQRSIVFYVPSRSSGFDKRQV